MKTFFYIIQRNGMIHEIENIGNRFVSALEQWQKGGLIIFPNLGSGINSVDITNILNNENYDSFISSVQPKQFIKNGTWYDIKDKSIPIRYEKWRELELEEKKKLMLKEPQKELTSEESKALFNKYRPEFMKKVKTI